MATSTEDWSVNANEATQISFTRSRSSDSTAEVVHSFHPQFTYPIFGFDEVIFGYKGLEIGIEFAAHDCRPTVSVDYKDKFRAVGETKASDINATLKKFLPATAFEDVSQQSSEPQNVADWVPPGSLVHKYTRRGREFEVWAGSLDDQRVRDLLNNIQIMVLFFIEGGQMLPLDELEWALQRWRVYYVYEKMATEDSNLSPYTLCGYATTWRFYKFIAPDPHPKQSNLRDFPDVPEVDLLNLSCRLRISQFLLFPPYQSAGHGSELYQLIYRDVMKDASIVELTVEDPSEEFDKLRDANDWKTLLPEFQQAKIRIDTEALATQNRIRVVPYKTLLPVDILNQIRTRKKIATRQFARLTELYLYSEIPVAHRDAVATGGGAGTAKLLIQKHRTPKAEDQQYYWWRTLVRARIFRKNKDVLMTQYEPDERRKHIQDACRGQQDEYEGLLIHMLEKEVNKALNGGAPSLSVNSRKRKAIVEDDEDEEDAGYASSSKVART